MNRKQASHQTGGIVFFLLGLLVALGIGWFVFPGLLYSDIKQPIRFDHPLHVEDEGMACEDCHSYREDGSYMGYPTTEQCAECHEEAMGEDPDEIKFVEEYVAEGKEVPWLTYQFQPDNVYFSHIAHDGMDCTECHIDVANMKTPPLYKRNWLSGYSKDTMKMWQCERCHAENDASNACFVCHK